MIRHLRKVLIPLMLLCFATTPLSVFAQEPSKDSTHLDNLVVGRTPINDTVKVSFVDQEKLNSSDIGILGAITQEYDHTEYSIQSYSRTGSLVGPRENEVTYASIARGETRVTTDTTEINTSVKISGSVDVNIARLINQSLGVEVSGGVKFTWSTTTTLSGPDSSSPYNMRLYMHAVDYDQYSYVVNVTEVYREYNGGNFQGYVYTSVGPKYVPDVKKPVSLSYSRDVNY